MCYQLVEDVWNKKLTLFMTNYQCVLRFCEYDLEVTRNLKEKIARSNKILKALKGRRDVHFVNMAQEEKKKLAETYTQQEVFWRQRSKQLWLRVVTKIVSFLILQRNIEENQTMLVVC